MSRRYTVICHRCGKSTFVDLSKTLSDQRCRACQGFLQGVDVSIGSASKQPSRKLVVKMAGSAGHEPVWHDQEAPVIPLRQRWPRYYKWVVAGGVACFLAAIGRVGYVKFRDSAGGHRPVQEQEASPEVDVRLTEEWRRKATAFARDVLAAKTVEELLPLLYHPEVGDDVIRNYYGIEEQLPLGTDLVEDYYVPPGEYAENVVAFSFMDGAKRPRAFVLVEKTGSMKVDWPSLVGLGEMSVKDYLRTAPPGVVVMRARARVGHYYNDYFTDSRKWLSIRLSDVTDENVIHGYYDRALPGANSMEQTFADPEADREKPDEPVIVVLKHPAGNVRSEQTEIVGLVSTTWYLQDGLKPLIEQARKIDAVRSGLSGDEPGTGAPEAETPPESVPPAAPAAPGPSGN